MQIAGRNFAFLQLCSWQRAREKITERQRCLIPHATALDGLSILMQLACIVYDEIEARCLVETMENRELHVLSINIAYQNRQNIPAKASAFIDFLLEHFREAGYERKWNS